MTNKQTAVEWLTEASSFNEFISDYNFDKAKKMEKEQTIEFAQIVLDNVECSFTGMAYLEKDINDIYNETYKQQDNG